MKFKEGSSYLIRLHRNNRTESKYKGVNILHVQIVRSYCIRHRVISKHLQQTNQPSCSIYIFIKWIETVIF